MAAGTGSHHRCNQLLLLPTTLQTSITKRIVALNRPAHGLLATTETIAAMQLKQMRGLLPELPRRCRITLNIIPAALANCSTHIIVQLTNDLLLKLGVSALALAANQRTVRHV